MLQFFSISNSRICLAMAGISVFALIFAYTAQYGFGLEPCELCLMQRVPYALVIALGLIGFKVQPRIFLSLIAACFSAGALIAGFHVGVEQHWWTGFTSCSANFDTSDLEALRQQILSGPRARCDDIPWSLFGISMAGYNFLFSLMLASFCYRQVLKEKPLSQGDVTGA